MKQLTILLFVSLLFVTCKKELNERIELFINGQKDNSANLPADGESTALVEVNIQNGDLKENYIKLTITRGKLYHPNFLSSVEANQELTIKAIDGKARCYVKSDQVIDSSVYLTCNVNGALYTQKVRFSRIYPDSFYIDASSPEPAVNELVTANVLFFKKENRFFHSAIPVYFQVEKPIPTQGYFLYQPFINSSKTNNIETASISIKNVQKDTGSTYVIARVPMNNYTVTDTMYINYK